MGTGPRGDRAPFWAQAGVVLLFLAPGLAGREGFGARNEGKGPVPLWSNRSCSRVCLEKRGGFDHCTEALITALCSCPGSAPFSCPFIHSSLSCPSSCVLTLQLTDSEIPHVSFPPANKEAAPGRHGAGAMGQTQHGMIRIHHSGPCLAETEGRGKVMC